MDSQERIYGLLLTHAKYHPSPDPAVSAEDLVQEAYLRCLGKFDPALPEHEQLAYLRRAITNLAIDHGRRAKLRQRGRFGPWLPSPQRVEDEAIAAAELTPIIDRAAAGDRATIALVALCMGYGWRDCMAGLGVSRKTVWRWCCARQGVLVT